MSFKDRAEAANKLADKLSRYKNKRPLVLGIPRGSVPMAKLIADKLQGDLDVVLVHKIGHPDNPEFAIGSVSEFGTIDCSDCATYYGFSEEFMKIHAMAELTKLRQRRKAYSPLRPPIDPKGRTVIIVDDGIATGSTMLAAIRTIKEKDAKTIVVAAPVAAPDTLDLLRRKADDVVVLEYPSEFFSIGQFYESFPQVSDTEVELYLREAEKDSRQNRRRTA